MKDYRMSLVISFVLRFKGLTDRLWAYLSFIMAMELCIERWSEMDECGERWNS